MPEGDTIHRTAVTLQRWLAGRRITAAETRLPELRSAVSRLPGQTVDEVSAQGKHLLMRVSSGITIHTHMGMRGAWHVYRVDEPWSRPAGQARLTITAGERLAVCFNAPVVELLGPMAVRGHAWLRGLGPDLLDPTFDPAVILRRAAVLPGQTPIGDVLLDQQVLAGIGNIWRSETLWRHRLHRSTPLAAVDQDTLGAVVTTAAELLRQSTGPGGARPGRGVYGRSGRPCPRCRTLVKSGRVGLHARTAYWCPRCQPAPDDRTG